jgi:hypothetical protein
MGYALMGPCWARSGGKGKKKKKNLLYLSQLSQNKPLKKTITKERKKSLCNITIVIFLRPLNIIIIK